MNQNFVMIFIILISFNSYFTRNKKEYNFNGSKVYTRVRRKKKNEKMKKEVKEITKVPNLSYVCVCKYIYTYIII